MMNYNLFKEVVTEKFKDYLSKEYKDMDMYVNPVAKVNHTLDGISLLGRAEERRVSATIYINEMYDHYMECNDLQEVLRNAAAKMEQSFQQVLQFQQIDLADAKEHIVFELVNTEQNREMLKNMPHREFQDLSIIYRWVVNMDSEGIHSTKVNNTLAKRLNLSEEQLFSLAAENTRRILPPCIKSMDEVIRDMFVKEGMPAEIADSMISEMPQEQPMWVISNDRGIDGAVSMLYEDKLYALAQQSGTDLYILPSSLHEVIALPANMRRPENLAQMVYDINMSQVALGERLSNQVYYYDKDLRKLSLATDTPNKRLDGVISEPPMVYETKQTR